MRLLIFRFSAMGDVALTVPALRAVLEPHAEVTATLVTRPLFAPFFAGLPRLTLITPDLGRYGGVAGLRRLYRELQATGDYDAVIDLHDVLRTQVLRLFFRAAGVPVYVIDKGRREKRALIKGRAAGPLKHTVVRYLDVFRKAGLTPQMPPPPYIHTGDTSVPAAAGFPALGFAPLARHALKTWPEEQMTALLQLLGERYPAARFYLFGGPEERPALERLAAAAGDAAQLTLDMPLQEQLALMRQMKVFVSMDSSNMHLAALLGVPVVSVWGATHPWAGFTPWGGDEQLMVQIPREELPCRPCTVYGKGSCRRGDLACLTRITPERVAERIDEAMMR